MKMTADSTALQMVRERGYVVLGIPANATDRYTAGDHTIFWGGRMLLSGELEVLAPTDRADWDAQFVALFGHRKKDKSKPEPGQRFFRCVLINAAAPEERP